ncbi:hypothetical protein ACN47E_000829 [Coniothyrium glycines]
MAGKLDSGIQALGEGYGPQCPLAQGRRGAALFPDAPTGLLLLSRRSLLSHSPRLPAPSHLNGQDAQSPEHCLSSEVATPAPSCVLTPESSPSRHLPLSLPPFNFKTSRCASCLPPARAARLLPDLLHVICSAAPLGRPCRLSRHGAIASQAPRVPSPASTWPAQSDGSAPEVSPRAYQPRATAQPHVHICASTIPPLSLARLPALDVISGCTRKCSSRYTECGSQSLNIAAPFDPHIVRHTWPHTYM